LSEITVDARGHRCPVPTLRLAQAARRAAPGTVLRLVCDDPLARIDAPHFAAQAGLEVVDLTVEGDILIVRVRKPA